MAVANFEVVGEECVGRALATWKLGTFQIHIY